MSGISNRHGIRLIRYSPAASDGAYRSGSITLAGSGSQGTGDVALLCWHSVRFFISVFVSRSSFVSSVPVSGDRGARE